MSKELHIAIVDDENIQLDAMKSLINQTIREMGLHAKVSSYSSGEAFLFELEDNKGLDIVFLDIEMKQINGLEVAKKIREIDHEVTLVFATAFAEYAVQGYEVQALDYLLKPIERDKIKQVIQRHLDKKPLVKETLTLEAEGEMHKLLLDDILYIEVIKRECEIHLNNQVITVTRPLKELEDKLNADFIQTHRSYLVNVAHIHRLLKTDVELSNGQTVPVSRRLAKTVQEKFIAFNKGAVFYND